MASKKSKVARSLRKIGEIQVNDWDFMGLINKDISELELSRSLRKLGSLQVMAWDFRTVLPAVNKLAHQEIDVVGIVKRTAQYKVIDWDFRNPPATKPAVTRLYPEEMQAVIERLKNFLQYIVGNLIDEPGHAQIKVREISPNVLRFKLVLMKRDVAMLIGREGHTASAIRSILKSTAAAHGVHALLEIHSHEEEMAAAHGEEPEA
jgi:predicted RNA-binding protein YlqC (UPF0109 family)